MKKLKKLSLCLILALACASAIFAETTSTYVASGGTWIWPLGADENGQPVGEVVLRPGYAENPVHGNVFWNADYYISADEGTPIYAPVDGTIRDAGIGIALPDGGNTISWGIDLSEYFEKMNPDDLIEWRAKYIKRNPLYTPENMSKSFGIQMNDGKTLWLGGFLDVSVKEGQKVTKGQQIGTLGYNPTFYKDPSIKLALSTKADTVGTELGSYLLGENNNLFFASIMRDISYHPEKVLTKEELTEDWNIFKIALLEDHPALIDPLIATKVQQKVAEIDIRLNDMETVSVHDFYLFAREALATAHCVHTPLTRLDTEYALPISPLQLVLYEGQCFVVWDRRGNNEIPTGTEIFAVNGIPIKELAQKMENFVLTDTINPDVTQLMLGNHFTGSLQSYFLNDSYSFTLKDEVVELPTLSPEQIVSAPVVEQNLYEQVDKDTAVLRVGCMSLLSDRDAWTAYFKEISENNTKNLILDLRGNGGGDDDELAFLLSYFLEQPFQTYKYNEIKHGGVYNSGKYSDMGYAPDAEYPLMLAEFQTPTDGAYRSKNDFFFNPVESYGFKGNLYVLVDTFSASGAVRVAGMLAENGAVTIGTETRGGYRSTNAQTYTTVYLGETNLKLKMPLTRVVFTTDESSGNPPNRGLIPEHIVYATLDEKLYGSEASDSQLNYTLELIKSKEQKRIVLIALAVVLVVGIPVAVVFVKKRRKAVT